MPRGTGGQSPSNLSQFLKGISFPADKRDLVQKAQQNNADREVIDGLNRLPDQSFGSMADVMKGLGKTH